MYPTDREAAIVDAYQTASPPECDCPDDCTACIKECECQCFPCLDGKHCAHTTCWDTATFECCGACTEESEPDWEKEAEIREEIREEIEEIERDDD